MIKLLKNSGIFILVALTVIFIFEITCRLLKIPKITHHNINAKSRNLVPKINNHSILFLGDSRVEWGIKPLKIREKLKNENINVINLALPSSNGLDVLRYLKKNHIFPKLIIMGNGPNYGLNNNHGLDTIIYSWEEKIKANLKYAVNQRFYISDRSVIEYVKHGFPLYKRHKYDAWGGVIVDTYGDFAQRSDEQVSICNENRSSFDSLSLNRYSDEVNALLKTFKENGTRICGLYMPVLTKIYEIENSLVKTTDVKIDYDRYYDFSRFTYSMEEKKHDSVYLHDGSHLAHEYSYIFSEKLADIIKNDTALRLRKND